MANGITIELRTLEMIQVLLQDNLEVNKERLKVEKQRMTIEEMRLREEIRRSEIIKDADKRAEKIDEERLAIEAAREERAKAIDERNSKMFDSLKDIMPTLVGYYQRTFGGGGESVVFRFEDLTPEQIKEMEEKLGVPPGELKNALANMPPGMYPPGFGPEAFRSVIPPVEDPTRVCANKKCSHFRQAHLQGDANCLMGGCECDKFEAGEEVGQEQAPDDFRAIAKQATKAAQEHTERKK
jgi:hypothetical protein